MPNSDATRQRFQPDPSNPAALIADPIGTQVPGRVAPSGEEPPRPSSLSPVSAGARAIAEGLIGDIGREFNRLRKKGRAAAWADLEDKVASGGSILISTGMITAKDWVGMMIDIEQFRKSEGGSEEMPGDALAKWLSEPGPKGKPTSKPPAIVDVPIKRSNKVRIGSHTDPPALVPTESDDEEFTLPDEES